MIPGRALHRLAVWVCTGKALAQIIEPAIADLQNEFREADAAGPVKRLRVLSAGYGAILRVIVMCALGISAATESDRQVIVRTMGWSFALTTAFTTLLMLPPLSIVDGSLSTMVLASLIPQALPLAIPVGLAFGIALGLSRHTQTLEVIRVILLCAIVGSVVSFATLGWMMPASNQWFRESLTHKAGVELPLTKGPNEMTWSELDRQATIAAAAGDRRRSGRYAWSFHLRFALSLASIVLAGLLLGIRFIRTTARTLLALLACVAYWSLMHAGEQLATYSSSGPGYHRAGMIPIIAGAWLPNIVLAAAAVLIASSRSSSVRGPTVAAP